MQRIRLGTLSIFLFFMVVGFNFPATTKADGGMDLNGFCQSLGYAGDTYVSANPAAYGWRCRDANGGTHDMNLYDECLWQYGGGTPVASDLNNANSWTCTNTPNQSAQSAPAPQQPQQQVAPSSNNGGGSSTGSGNNNSGGGGNSEPTNCNHQAVSVGDTAQVTPGESNNLRSSPSLSSKAFGSIPAGGQFTVTNGPTCADGYQWWEVNFNGKTGWTVQGGNGSDWIVKVSSQSANPKTPVSFTANNVILTPGVIPKLQEHKSFIFAYVGKCSDYHGWSVTTNLVVSGNSDIDPIAWSAQGCLSDTVQIGVKTEFVDWVYAYCLSIRTIHPSCFDSYADQNNWTVIGIPN